MVDRVRSPGLGSASTKRLKRGADGRGHTDPGLLRSRLSRCRFNIVARLAEGDATVGQLAEPYQMTLQAVYKHLRVLEDAGLVSLLHGPQPRPVRLETGVLTEMGTWASSDTGGARSSGTAAWTPLGDHEPHRRQGWRR